VRASSRRDCPVCGADSIRLSVLNVRRRRPVTCVSCGAKLEITVPSLPYSLITWTAAILGSMLVPVLLVMMLYRQWGSIALSIALLFALIFGSNEFLNRRATVQRAPEPGPNDSSLRRWFRD
jgi:hypothetical protein